MNFDKLTRIMITSTAIMVDKHFTGEGVKEIHVLDLLDTLVERAAKAALTAGINKGQKEIDFLGRLEARLELLAKSTNREKKKLIEWFNNKHKGD